MVKNYDLVVIGTGSAGSTAAGHLRRAGWSVAIIDNRPFGGTCALRGCDPKKVLVGAADLVDWSERMQENKAFKGKAEIDWQALMKFKRTFTDPHPGNKEKGFAKAGIEAFRGTARFTGKNTIAVGDGTLEGRFIVIATGAKPAKLPMEGAEHLLISDDFLELEKLPKRMVFVGGGYISLEFAHVVARAGAKVTVLHRGERLLEGFDKDLVYKLAKASKEAGINVVLGVSVEAVEKKGEGFMVRASSDGKKQFFDADIVVHGAGRAPNISELDLEKGGVQAEKRGISVNEYLQSVSNPAVYAAGDVAASGGLPLTPIAGLDGYVVARNILEGNKYTADYTATPTVVFTIPPLASVGLGEEQAKEQNLKFRVNFTDTSDWYSSRRINQKHSASKVLVEEGSEKIVGAHILGHNAEEIINIFALAIKHNLTASDLNEMIWAYPTNASDIPYMV
ncbi:MAG: NAD(P)/FAD-dependent oxidoreductase [Candidatus Liptonbacteria bacterium]|nr:NAD(P)/FAD-dependent oxidoreductase [Candidatus Liptonbacteria bacterium]